jgi:benzoate-CoA ligase family protein
MALALPVHLNIAEEFLGRPAREHPDRIAIVGEPSAASYAEVAAAANRVGNALREWGCERGDRILLVLPDSLEFIAAFFGVSKIGAIAVPVNSFARAADYEYWLADCGARFAIVHAAALPEFIGAEQRHHLAETVVVGAPEKGAGRGSFLRWENWLEGASERLEPYPTAATDPAFFLYTSGSGGTPKGAVHRHQDMVVTSRGFAQGVLGLRAEDVAFSVSKLFFAYGLGNGMYFPFSVGASTVLMPERPKPERVAELVARLRPTAFFSVPTFYAALLREAERGAKLDFSSVRVAVSAGETLPAEIFERFRKRFGLEILDGIGSTEMLHMFLSSRPGKARPGSCGVEVPNYEAKIVDDSGGPIPDGELGNLWVKGQSAFAAYWGKPELTALTKLGDWVVTGDKFTRDADGYYHYGGRTDDMMKVSGMWVSPGEVENALLAHPMIAEAAVVARADSVGFLRAAAYVVLRGGIEAGPHLTSEIQQWLKGRLVSYKCPQEIHYLDELPKTATGKIQRFRLREG